MASGDEGGGSHGGGGGSPPGTGDSLTNHLSGPLQGFSSHSPSRGTEEVASLPRAAAAAGAPQPQPQRSSPAGGQGLGVPPLFHPCTHWSSSAIERENRPPSTTVAVLEPRTYPMPPPSPPPAPRGFEISFEEAVAPRGESVRELGRTVFPSRVPVNLGAKREKLDRGPLAIAPLRSVCRCRVLCPPTCSIPIATAV